MTGAGGGIPAFLPWQAGLGLIGLGLVLILLGWRQRRRPVDIDRLPWSSWVAKTFLGGLIIAVGLAQLTPLLTA